MKIKKFQIQSKKKILKLIILALAFIIIVAYKSILKRKNKGKIKVSKYPFLYNKEECSHNYYQKRKIEPTEETNGMIVFSCGLCNNEYIEIIPKLNENDYDIIMLKTNCQHGKGKRYISKKKKEIYYDITDNKTLLHSIYGHKCEVCHQNIGEFIFEKYSDIICDGYPRLYKLSNYWNNTWLLGGDNGTILCRRSEDEGIHWSNPVIVSNFPNHICSNVDFFELPSHEIICTYRLIGKYSLDPDINYNRKIYSSISKDGGKTWENLGLVVDNFDLAEQFGKTKYDAYFIMIQEINYKFGFFEPFVSLINNEVTVIYADDFTPMFLYLNRYIQIIYSQTLDLKTMKWSKNRKIILDGSKKKSPTKSGLKERYSRDGMPVIDVMKDGTYVVVFEGTYRNYNYTLFTGETLNEHKEFVILISYSKDGVNWSNPVEVFIPKNEGSKSSAPYLCITDNNQLIISFQTDEDSISSGMVGDPYSIMKVIISKPGIKIEDINSDSFYAINNVYKNPIGTNSLWNGMMLIGNKLFTASSGHPILYTDIPIYSNPEDYNNILKDQYDVISGNASFIGNKIYILKEKTLILKKKFIIPNNKTFYTYITPNITGDCGLIFGFNNSYKTTIKNYYIVLIRDNGLITFGKKIKDVYVELSKYDGIQKEFNKNNNYKISIQFNFIFGEIKTTINDKIQFINKDKSLKGKEIGLISNKPGAIFTQVLLE